ncbi:MAG: Gmad2 immunoglobulin-like domain-containing protein [Candidatus Paceibacterota bacterium]
MRKIYFILGAILLACVVLLVYAKTSHYEPLLKDISQNDMIRVTYPKPTDKIESPLVVKGEARGTWFFEASFPIIVVNWDGLIMGEGYAKAKGDWMTEDFVPFEGTITFTRPENIVSGTYNERGAVIFKKDNPSGDPARDAAVEIPIIFK